MKISEKQIMQLMSIVMEYQDHLRSLGIDNYKDYACYACAIGNFLSEIHGQQSEELKVIE